MPQDEIITIYESGVETEYDGDDESRKYCFIQLFNSLFYKKKASNNFLFLSSK